MLMLLYIQSMHVLFLWAVQPVILDWISSHHQPNQKSCTASHSGSFQRHKHKSGCSRDSKPALTHSSLSHECASDRGLSLLTPKLVVTICAKVSPCSFSKQPQTPASPSLLFPFGALTSWLGREICKRHAIMAAGFFFFYPDLTTHMVCRSAPKRYPAARDTFTGTKCTSVSISYQKDKI